MPLARSLLSVRYNEYGEVGRPYPESGSQRSRERETGFHHMPPAPFPFFPYPSSLPSVCRTHLASNKWFHQDGNYSNNPSVRPSLFLLFVSPRFAPPPPLLTLPIPAASAFIPPATSERMGEISAMLAGAPKKAFDPAGGGAA